MISLSFRTRNVIYILTALLAVMVVPSRMAQADRFEQQSSIEIPVQGETVDLAVTPDGRWTFVLTSRGEVAVYNAVGEMIQTIKVGRGFERLEYDGTSNRLVLGGSGQQKLKVITLAMRFEIDTEASPILGPADAPVTIAVYSDFQ